jgi:class 3 adenylate cyclase/pimeloyl-ACP methyl ester carboxylesterase
MEQQIGFCTTSDGVGIAYATAGDGPPLVYVCGWPGHLAMEWELSPRTFLEDMARGVTLVRYDMRGSGLSDRDVDDFSVPTLVKDLEAVVDHVKLERFDLLSLGLLGGPIAMTYAAAHPERISRLVLSSAFLHGEGIMNPQQRQAMVSYIETFGYPLAVDANMKPEDLQQLQEVVQIQKAASSNATMAQVARSMVASDLSDVVGQLPEQILIVHGRDDDIIPFRLGRELALQLPHAQFVPLEGSTGSPWTIRQLILAEVQRFLGIDATPAAAPRAAAQGSLVTILFTDIEDSTALTQHLGDERAQGMVQAHNSIVRDALRVYAGSEIKHTGDGIMASFPTASGALECAITIQRAVQAHTAASTDHHPLRVRIGVNAGEPVADGDDLFGTAVQLARRICDSSGGGEIFASDVVRQLAAGKRFMFADRGAEALKGFEDPVRLYELRWRDDASP